MHEDLLSRFDRSDIVLDRDSLPDTLMGKVSDTIPLAAGRSLELHGVQEGALRAISEQLSGKRVRTKREVIALLAGIH